MANVKNILKTHPKPSEDFIESVRAFPKKSCYEVTGDEAVFTVTHNIIGGVDYLSCNCYDYNEKTGCAHAAAAAILYKIGVTL